MDNIPWWKTGRTEVGGNPFASLGLDYCMRCRMEVDTDTEGHHQGDIYVYRRRCLRCGRIVKYGSYIISLLGVSRPLPDKVFVWINEPGKDRR